MFDKLEKVKQRYNEISELLNKPETINDQSEFRRLSKEYSDLTQIVNAYDEYLKVRKELEENKKLLFENHDAEYERTCNSRTGILQSKFDTIEADIKELLVPKDPNDSKNAILEIRAGTGGDEAALFAADLYRMYSRYAERKGWKMEIVTFNESSGPGGT